jgi:hypothetical protein
LAAPDVGEQALQGGLDGAAGQTRQVADRPSLGDRVGGPILANQLDLLVEQVDDILGRLQAVGRPAVRRAAG